MCHTSAFDVLIQQSFVSPYFTCLQCYRRRTAKMFGASEPFSSPTTIQARQQICCNCFQIIEYFMISFFFNGFQSVMKKKKISNEKSQKNWSFFFFFYDFFTTFYIFLVHFKTDIISNLTPGASYEAPDAPSPTPIKF